MVVMQQQEKKKCPPSILALAFSKCSEPKLMHLYSEVSPVRVNGVHSLVTVDRIVACVMDSPLKRMCEAISASAGLD